MRSLWVEIAAGLGVTFAPGTSDYVDPEQVRALVAVCLRDANKGPKRVFFWRGGGYGVNRWFFANLAVIFSPLPGSFQSGAIGTDNPRVFCVV